MPVSPALGSRSKKLPCFGDFLRASPYAKVFDENMSNAAAIGFFLSLGAGYAMYEWIGWIGIVVTVIVVLPVLIAISERIAKKRMKISALEEARIQSLNEVMKRLRGYLDSGRLHRYLEPVAAAVLEESAKNWKRIQEALESPAWKQASLPAHYVSIREQAIAASNRSMEDLVLLLKSSIRSQPKTEDWQVAFTRFVGEVVGVNLEQQDEDNGFPIEYEPARDIANKLGKLATEIESATRKLLREDFVKEQFTSSSSIDSVLGELRAIEVAEGELQDHIRH